VKSHIPSSIARALHCSEIDWSVVLERPIFPKAASHLIPTFAIVSLFDMLHSNPAFANVRFESCSTALNDSHFVETFQSHIQHLIVVHNDHLTMLASLVDQAAVEVNLSTFIDTIIVICRSPVIFCDGLSVVHSFVCFDSRFRSSCFFLHFVLHLLYGSGVDLEDFFHSDNSDTADLL
jgi:hypothetical protein